MASSSTTTRPSEEGAPPMPEPRYDLRGKRVFVAGHRGMVGAALTRRLAREPVELLTAPRA